jgi:intracellular septation protein A
MFQITDKGWNIITRNWGLLFICTGISNQLFWHVAHSEDDWIIFRVIVTLMLFLFSISQLLVSKQERLPHASAWGLKKN